jgi:hypothetical protein
MSRPAHFPDLLGFTTLLMYSYLKLRRKTRPRLILVQDHIPPFDILRSPNNE